MDQVSVPWVPDPQNFERGNGKPSREAEEHLAVKKEKCFFPTDLLKIGKRSTHESQRQLCRVLYNIAVIFHSPKKDTSPHLRAYLLFPH